VICPALARDSFLCGAVGGWWWEGGGGGGRSLEGLQCEGGGGGGCDGLLLPGGGGGAPLLTVLTGGGGGLLSFPFWMLVSSLETPWIGRGVLLCGPGPIVAGGRAWEKLLEDREGGLRGGSKEGGGGGFIEGCTGG